MILGNSMVRFRDCQKVRQPTRRISQFRDTSKGKIFLQKCVKLSLGYVVSG